MTFEDSSKNFILGYGLIAKQNVIEPVVLIDGLNYNLWIISQSCDHENSVCLRSLYKHALYKIKKTTNLVLTRKKK